MRMSSNLVTQGLQYLYHLPMNRVVPVRRNGLPHEQLEHAVTVKAMNAPSAKQEQACSINSVEQHMNNRAFALQLQGHYERALQVHMQLLDYYESLSIPHKKLFTAIEYNNHALLQLHHRNLESVEKCLSFSQSILTQQVDLHCASRLLTIVEHNRCVLSPPKDAAIAVGTRPTF